MEEAAKERTPNPEGVARRFVHRQKPRSGRHARAPMNFTNPQLELDFDPEFAMAKKLRIRITAADV
jgi:hypothetical protein